MGFAKPSVVSCSLSLRFSGQSVAQTVWHWLPSLQPFHICYRAFLSLVACAREIILCITSDRKLYPEVLFKLKFPSVRAMQVRSSLNYTSIVECVCPNHSVLIMGKEANVSFSCLFFV